MKKIKAFLVAVLLLVGFILGLHGLASKVSLKTDPGFKMWYNQYKDKSYSAISHNVDSNTMFVFGSSEFGHHQKSWYHIRNMFKDKDLDVALIGQPYTQSINHTIALAALAKKTANKKVVLVVSPTWFRGDGIDPNAFSIRFSDSQYIQMLKNPKLSRGLKQRIIKRTLDLLQNDKKALDRVHLYNSVYFYGDKSLSVRMKEAIVEAMRLDQESCAVRLAMLAERESYQKGPATIKHPERIDWTKLQKKAYRQSIDESHNPLYIADKQWKRKFKKKMQVMKDAHRGDELTQSQEYKDLKLFLEVARAEGMDAQLVIQPINGYWYDHTGMSKKKRQACYEKIHEVAKAYKAKVVDLSGYGYGHYVLSDAVHPWKKGWVLINEAIYNFYKDKPISQR